MTLPDNYNGWILQKDRNPYRGFRYEKGMYAVGSQRIKGVHNFFVQELKGGYKTSSIKTGIIIRKKPKAFVVAMGLMDRIDKGELRI